MSRITKTILGGLIAAGIAALRIAIWPASEADRAREDGEQFDAAVDDPYDRAEDFRSEAPEVQQAIWDGFEEGDTAS